MTNRRTRLSVIAERRTPMLRDMVNHVVDVRAVMDYPDITGHRHFSFGAAGKMIRMALVIDERLGVSGPRTRTRQTPTWALGI